MLYYYYLLNIMGVCGSTNSSENIIEDVHEDIDFEKPLEDIREKQDKNILPIDAKLYEFTKVNPKRTRKNLILKYLFFTPNGKFTSSVKTMVSELLITGEIEPKTNQFKLITKQQVIENNSYKVKIYEGKLILNDNMCMVSGNVYEDGANGKVKLDKNYFEVDFTTNLWKGKYDRANKVFDIKAYINYKDLYYSGLALDDKGLSLLRGNEIEGKCNLIQVYIDTKDGDGDANKGYICTESKENENNKLFVYSGVLDGISNKYQGTVSNIEIEKDTKFVFDILGDPKDEKNPMLKKKK